MADRHASAAPQPYGLLLDPFVHIGAHPPSLARAPAIDPESPLGAAPLSAPLTAMMSAAQTGDVDGAPLASVIVAEAAPLPISVAPGRNVETASPSPSGVVPASVPPAVTREVTMALAKPDLPIPTPVPRGLDAPHEVDAFNGTERVPLPAPRPAGLQPEGREAPVRTPSRREPVVAAKPTDTSPTPDGRNVLEKLFGIGAPPGAKLAYATPETGSFFGSLFGSRPSTPVPTNGGTAIYDISAHTVYMPDGSRLEAHSGLGALLDDPRSVHQKMRGATPPAVYDLSLRESLFHGVQALRLNPVGGSNLYRRNGLLAHTYMLGANGDSNGCVSFRDYNAFLKAYMSGQVRRLVVVANR